MKNKKQSSLIIILGVVCFLIIIVIGLLIFLNKPEYIQEQDKKTSETSSRQIYPLYFSITIHMENDWKDDTDAGLFQKHVDQLEWAMDLFDDYDAKLTIESAEPFATAVLDSGNTILLDALERGHGVGTHCGGARGKTTPLLAARFKEIKSSVDAIVSASNNRGCSGGWGSADPVIAALNAGFGYLDGVTYLAYLSMPQSERPNHVSDEEIRTIYYHDPAIPEFSEHIYPHFLKNADDLEEDPNGELVILNGELGEIFSLYEGRKNCWPDCVLTTDDFASIYANITAANAIRDQHKVAHLFIHLPLATFQTSNEALLRSWLEQMQTLQNEGNIQWATMGEVYDAKLSERE